MTIQHLLATQEERLYFEVMEDYIITAELGHIAKDQAKHKEEMREHYAKLLDWHHACIKEVLEKVIEREKSTKITEIIMGVKNTSERGDGWNDAKSDTIKHLEAIINDI